MNRDLTAVARKTINPAHFGLPLNPVNSSPKPWQNGNAGQNHSKKSTSRLTRSDILGCASKMFR
jgi:hypothetical protein